MLLCGGEDLFEWTGPCDRVTVRWPGSKSSAHSAAVSGDGSAAADGLCQSSAQALLGPKSWNCVDPSHIPVSVTHDNFKDV